MGPVESRVAAVAAVRWEWADMGAADAEEDSEEDEAVKREAAEMTDDSDAEPERSW
jgi:hypothetical protein